MPRVRLGVGFSELFKLRNGNQGVIEMSYIEKFWRDAAADVVDVMNGKEVEARFRDSATERWIEGLLGGWAKGDRYHWLDESGSSWTFCQVYAPPQWWLDKPDPGDEFRLLGKFPDEALQPGDEAVSVAGLWHKSEQARIGGRQAEGIWYRRKLEQPKPEPKFAVGQRVRVVGPKQSPAVNWDRQMDKYNGGVAEVISVSSVVGSKVFYDLRFIEQWAFREDYLEPAVEPKHYTLQVGDTADAPSGHRIAITEHGVEVT